MFEAAPLHGWSIHCIKISLRNINKNAVVMARRLWRLRIPMRKFRTTFLQPYDTTKLYTTRTLGECTDCGCYYSVLLGFSLFSLPRLSSSQPPHSKTTEKSIDRLRFCNTINKSGSVVLPIGCSQFCAVSVFRDLYNWYRFQTRKYLELKSRIDHARHKIVLLGIKSPEKVLTFDRREE